MGFSSVLGEKIILCEVRFNPCEVKLSKNQKIRKNSKFQYERRQRLVTIFNYPSYCWPFWMAAHTKNHKNGYHGSVIQDVQQKPNTTKYRSIFLLNISCPSWMAAINKNKYIVTMVLSFKIKEAVV